MVFIVMHIDKAIKKPEDKISSCKKPEQRLPLKPLLSSNKSAALEMAKREVKCNSNYAVVHNVSNMCDVVKCANSSGPIAGVEEQQSST